MIVKVPVPLAPTGMVIFNSVPVAFVVNVLMGVAEPLNVTALVPVKPPPKSVTVLLSDPLAVLLPGWPIPENVGVAGLPMVK